MWLAFGGSFNWKDVGTDRLLHRVIVRGSADTVGHASVDCLWPVSVAWAQVTRHVCVCVCVCVVGMFCMRYRAFKHYWLTDTHIKDVGSDCIFELLKSVLSALC